MALVVETGSGSSTAESYITVEAATTYHAAQGNTAWASLASDTVREQLLRKATGYMEQVYRYKWQGTRVLSTQALSWPRHNVVVDTFEVSYSIVPAEVKNACAELALKASISSLYADQGQAVVRESIGPIEVEYASGSSSTTQYKSVSAMLKPYFVATGNMGIRV